ncbi:MAG: hypothetical protein CML17_10800 [Pusillimonas sp.]|nr:hypothetical protein [Pusillimonas sp.]
MTETKTAAAAPKAPRAKTAKAAEATVSAFPNFEAFTMPKMEIPAVTREMAEKSIEQAREAYLNTDLPKRFARYHQNPDSAFWGWNDIWLNPEFKFWNIEAYLPKIRCPILAIQGKNDEYGTLAQIQGIQRIVPHTKLCIIDDCRHSPHKDQPEVLNKTLVAFIQKLNETSSTNA